MYYIIIKIGLYTEYPVEIQRKIIDTLNMNDYIDAYISKDQILYNVNSTSYTINSFRILMNVLKINNVRYINDSKATNVNATYFALESMSAPTVWIVGGVDKGNDYSALFPFVNEKVKAIICLGKDNEVLFQNFEQMVDIIVETQYMSEAVKIAYNIATAGENVLLSPACASFDLFKNYEDRGHQFKSAVRAL